MIISISDSNDIKQKALDLGFSLIGFAKAELLEKESDNLQKWIGMNYDADMSWINRGMEKRKDLKLILDDANSVISLGFNYYHNANENYDNLPKISKYAKGTDYHIIIKNKLKELNSYIKELIPNSKTIFYTDDGPVMDKVWAVKAGLGWQGKHSNIINHEYGSWIFLSEIIVNFEIPEYSTGIPDGCGTCRICIDSCPTGAIVQDGVVDSNLCISYQTIENKKEIPGHMNLNGWIYGCDICQDVCPYNKNDRNTNELSFIVKEELKNKTSSELREISEEQFRLIFKDSPIKRTKYKGWIRNLEKYEKEISVKGIKNEAVSKG